jgi:diguanylate cyclase (GGDEF)-like protein
LCLCLCAILFAVIETVASRFLSSDLYSVNLPVSVLILFVLTGILLATGGAVHLMRHWITPVRRLRAGLEEIRDGRLPIDQLPTDVGGLSPLTPVLADLLRQLRQQKAERAKLSLEMNHRVAQRTDALERVVATLRTQSTRDVLTGLYNRRMLDLSLDKLIERCGADQTPLCVLMIDVDDFKLLNDTLGHHAGDAMLRATGQLIRSSIREQDLAFRCGGDEFVIVLPGVSCEHAQSVARRLAELVDALVKPLEVPRKPRLSIGIAMLAEVGPTASSDDLLKAADRQLYSTKAARKSTAAPPTRAA